jgi:hypothetical protein
MASDREDRIQVKVTKAIVNCIVTGTDPNAFGYADIYGVASLWRDPLFHKADTDMEEFIGREFYMLIQGRSASQAKALSTVWSPVFDELITNDNVVGIFLHEHKRAHVYVSPSQFEKLMSSLGLGTRTDVMLYLRESVRPECDLIVRVDFYTRVVGDEA